MNLYIWRHNKTYHSHSMINEPCVVNEFYLDALAIVEAETLDDALKLLEERKEGRPAGTGTHRGAADRGKSNLHPHPGFYRSSVKE